MIVVSDSSSLIALSAAAHLDLLRRLYDEVVVPEAVWKESTMAHRPGAAAIRQADWIRIVPVANRAMIARLPRKVGPGESEAIVLAMELDADVLLIDERRARKAALELGLPVTGILGVLLESKKRGLISAVKPVLDHLEAAVAFRLKRALYESVLREAGEG